MSDNTVAVSIPTLGRRDALARCIRAVAGGSVTPDLIVVVDQSQDDGLEQLCREAAAGRVEVRLVAQERTGLSAARNAGLRSVGQALLAITDDDCEPDSEWLAAALAAFEAEPALVACCGRVLPLPDPTGTLTPVSSRTSEASRTYRRTFSPWQVGSGGNMIVRAAALRAAGGFDERLGAGSAGGAGEDVDLLHRLLRLGPVRYEAAMIVRHEQRPRELRRETRRRYGRGVGAAAVLWLRERDARAPGVLAAWMLLRFRLLLAAARRRDGAEMTAELRVLAGTLAGTRYAARAQR
jgi:GT2 family glycosyltransferase